MTEVHAVLTMLIFQIILMTLISMSAYASYNCDVVDANTSWVADLGGRTDFQLAVVGRESGHVFVAARDRLYQLDDQLNLLHSVSTLPQCRRDKQHRQMVTPCAQHNDATLLRLLPNSRTTDTGRDGVLLLCGTDQDRPCQLFLSSNLTALRQRGRLQQDQGLRLIADGPIDSVVVCVGAPQSRNITTHLIYVATSTTDQDTDASIRSVTLIPDGLSTSFRARPRHNAEGRLTVRRQPSWTDFVFRFVAGFEYSGFVYFVTVQREFPTFPLSPKSSLVTRLVRLCSHDVGFQSYTELTLHCRSPTANRNSGPATAAQLASKVGGDGRRRWSLFVLFGSDASSALCVYTMDSIVVGFIRAQKDCYRGNGVHVEWIMSAANTSHSRCQPNVKIAATIDESFCGDALNGVGIGGRYPLDKKSSWDSNSVLGTSLIVSTQNNSTVAVVGTVDGRLLKVAVDDVSLAVRRQFADVTLSDMELRDLVADSDQHYVYAVTSSRISRLAIDSCSLYADCESCVSSQDVLGCVWCSAHCVVRTECQMSHFEPLQPYDTHCPPVILHFSPRSGPTLGGTLITIRGERFGTLSQHESNATVRIGSADCFIVFRNSTAIVCRTGRLRGAINRDLRVFVSDSSKTTSPVNIRGTATSDNDSFAYKEVSVGWLGPTVGPRSGGSQLTLLGTNLDIGLHRSVLVAGQPCHITRSSSDKLVCTTSAYHAAAADAAATRDDNDNDNGDDKGLISMVIDNVQLDLNRTVFTYTDDPVIDGVQPATSFTSGGLKMTVFGHRLNIIQRPYIYFSLNDSYFSQECEAMLSGESMTCPSPRVSDVTQEEAVVNVSFKMDAVNLNRSSFELRYVHDPSILPANTSCTTLSGNFPTFLLHIQGEDLSLAATLTDYEVTVDGRSCNVTQLDMSQIECLLYSPPHTPNADVTVTVGFLTLNAGRVSCIYHLTDVVHATTAGAVVLLIVLTALVVSVSLLSVVCLKRARRWPFVRKCRMEPNVLYTANAPFLPFDAAAAAAGNDACNPNSYWTRSLSIRGDRLHHLTSLQRPQPVISCDEAVLDEETRRLLDDSHLLIATQRLILLDIIGQGHFGCVFRGILKVPGQKTEQEVAVKTLRSSTECYGGPSAEEMRTFLNEALTMREFSHQHVLRLLGIVIDADKMPLVVLPFMTHGDLLSYIRNDNNSPSVKDLMQFGIQIADGMEYLSSLKFVHRDLAARNCMLDDDMMVKVADFGLSRDIYERDYYSSDDRKAKLPVKWMALESLEKGIYNTRTDVWSYGVVLWELMTRGVCPYPEVDNWDIVKYLDSGRRMLRPPYCPEALYVLMLRCWNADPAQRPLFCELSSTVSSIIAKMEATATTTLWHGDSQATTGYVNQVNTDYLRPLARPTAAEPAPSQTSSSAAAAAASDDNEDDTGDCRNELIPPDSLDAAHDQQTGVTTL